MNIEYINPFIEASQTVLKKVASIDVKLGKVFVKNSPYKGDSIIIMVGLTGKIRGQAIFSMSTKLAMSIASRMMRGIPVLEFDEISKSAISELTNMILGNAATLLYNIGAIVEITPPSLLTGENIEISPSKLKTICVPLMLNDYDVIELDISIEGE